MVSFGFGRLRTTQTSIEFQCIAAVMMMPTLRWCVRCLSGVNQTLAVGFTWLAATFLALMTAFIILQVICRYGFNSSLFWPEDVSLMMMIWVAFAVAPIAYRTGANVALDTISRLLKGRVAYVLYLLIHLLVLTMLVLLTIEAVEMIARSKIRANSIPLQMKYVYMIMPIGFIAMICVAIELIGRCLIGLIRPTDPDSTFPSLPGRDDVRQV